MFGASHTLGNSEGFCLPGAGGGGLDVRGEGADVPVAGEAQTPGSEGPVLVHHVRHLGGEVAGCGQEHLPHVAGPG